MIDTLVEREGALVLCERYHTLSGLVYGPKGKSYETPFILKNRGCADPGYRVRFRIDFQAACQEKESVNEPRT